MHEDTSVTTDALQAAPKVAAAYQSKCRNYFAGARFDFIDQLPHAPDASILEIGCGSGQTGALALQGQRAGRYVGIELMEQAAADARAILSEVIVGDVEQMEFDWQPATFDVLILSEVLEHLREPGETLQRLARFVRPGGIVLASSPNVSHWRVIRELIQGRFPKADQGVFDRTHLRWFTPGSFAEMFEEAGYDIDRIAPVTQFSQRTQLISQLTGGRLDHLIMTQISLKGRRR